MGIVQRQGLRNSISLYLGIIVGFVSRVIIFPRALTEEEIGALINIIFVAQIFTQVASWGFPNIIVRFFPYFRDKAQKHNGLLSFAFLVSTLIFLMLSIPFLLMEDWVVAQFSEAPLFKKYYPYSIVLTLIFLYSAIFESMLRSLYKTVVSTFIREVCVKSAGVIAVLIAAAEWVDMDGFVWLYIGTFAFGLILQATYLVYLRELHLLPSPSKKLKRLRKSLLVYGGFSMMGYLGGNLLSYIDSLMIIQILGEGRAGIYVTVVPIVAVVMAPPKAIYQVIFPIVAEHAKAKAYDKLSNQYRRTSLITLIMGLYVGGGIIVNRDGFFDIIGNDAYRDAEYALILLVLSRIPELATSINGIILLTSKMYKWDLFFNVLLVFLAILSNIIFIDLFDITGAALATLLTFFLINASRTAFVYRFMHIHPFTWPMLWALLIGAGGMLIMELIPNIEPFWLDIPLRSGLYSLLFALPVLLLKISPDINNWVTSAWNRVKPF
ncbi:MAG: oligosaccharide flippase family protein [Bacteroidota bacterium]